MLQIIQYQKTGKLSVEEVPAPQLRPGHVLVHNVCSLVSIGTERTSVETAKASLLEKAHSRPDLVKQVVENVKREGLLATYKKVQNRLDNYKELGYSSAGLVVESAVDSIRVGERVACAGTAHHAEFVVVPKNLVARIPDSVDFPEGAFATLGAIALQGVRQAEVKLGERVAVIGLGLIGLLTVQLLKAAGCRVFGLDISESNLPRAKQLGCDECGLSTPEVIGAIESFTNGFGTDAVIITASTSSSEPVELAAQFARKKSAIVIVGAVGMDIPRSPFYKKELELKISCSYGPGRYDPEYETKGTDYPIGYVRWTENRNMQSFLDLIAEKKVTVQPLITHKFAIKDALKAYDLITGKRNDDVVGVLIEYPTGSTLPLASRIEVRSEEPRMSVERPIVGFVGAGNFAQSYILPNLVKHRVRLRGVVTSRAVNAKTVGHKFNFEYCGTDTKEVLEDKEIDVVCIATRHDSHATFVLEALKQGKHVYVEKPLAVTKSELDDLRSMYEKSQSVLFTGFNRRFSKPLLAIRDFFQGSTEPLVIAYRVHAGALPSSHWMLDESQGGRIVGEACHFVDCMSFIACSEPTRVFAESIATDNTNVKQNENVNVTIRFANGSIGNLLYLSNGDRSVPKEYLEVYSGGRTAIMNNFQSVVFYHGERRKSRSFDGSKGHAEEVTHFLRVVEGKEQALLSFASMYLTTLTTFKIKESLQRGIPVEVQ